MAGAGTDGQYLRLRPDLQRTGPDIFEFAATPSTQHAADEALTTAQLHCDWRPHHLFDADAATDAPKSKKPKIAGSPKKAPAPHLVDATLPHWESIDLIFCVPTCTSVVSVLDESQPWAWRLEGLDPASVQAVSAVADPAKDGWQELALLTSSSIVRERRLGAAVATPMLRFAATGGLNCAWHELGVADARAGASPWGLCAECAPHRPPAVWTAEGTRIFASAPAAAFERAIGARPPAWLASVRSASGSVKIAAQPWVLAHRAGEALRRGRAVGAVEARCRVVDGLSPPQSLLSFTIPGSAPAAGLSVHPPLFVKGTALFPRQRDALKWMMTVEDRRRGFEEREFGDAPLPHVGRVQLQVPAPTLARPPPPHLRASPPPPCLSFPLRPGRSWRSQGPAIKCHRGGHHGTARLESCRRWPVEFHPHPHPRPHANRV